MDFGKRGLLVNAFFYLHCNYFQLVWMCHNLTNNNKVNRLHERCLRLIYNDKNSSCEDLLEKGRSASIHHKNLRTFAVEFFKVFKGLSPVMFAKAFPVRQQGQYVMACAKTVSHGLEGLSYIGSNLWDSTPSHMKEIYSIN